MKKIYILILFIFVIPFLLSFLIKEIPNDVQPSLEGTQIIFKDLAVLQSFRPSMDNLSGIGMSIKNPYFRNKKDITFNILSENKQSLREVTINGLNIPDGDLIKISFDPVPNSKNKQYFLSILSKETTDNEAIEVFLTSKKTAWIGDLNINSEKQDSALSFITYHKSSNIFAVSFEIFTQLLKRLFTDLPFAVFYLIVIGGITFYLIRLKDTN